MPLRQYDTNCKKDLDRGIFYKDGTIVPLPKNYPEMEKVIREELEYHGVSVIVCRRECIQTLRRHAAKK